MTTRRDFLQYAGSAAGLALLPACAHTSSAQLAAEGASLDAIARSRGMRFGTAVLPPKLRYPELAALIEHECSVLVAANDFKWRQTEKQPGQYTFENATEILDFARARDMQSRGHAFVWSDDTFIPDWLKEQEAELAQNGGARLLKLMEDRVQRLKAVGPDITSWDVVNEMIVSIGGEVRSSMYTRIFGEEILDVAFGMMREAMPGVQLVYNDFMGWLLNDKHRDGVLRLLERALGRGVPIDALGLQSHLNTVGLEIDEPAWRRFLEEIEGMGLKMLVTELDAPDNKNPTTDPALRDAEIAAHTKAYLDLTLSFTSVEQVIIWEFSDWEAYTHWPGYVHLWGRKDGLPLRAHPYSANLKPRPMRQAIADALAAAPMR